MYTLCRKKVTLVRGPQMRTSLRKLRLCQAMRLELGTVHQDCEQHSGQRTALSRFTVRKDEMVVFSFEKNR